MKKVSDRFKEAITEPKQIDLKLIPSYGNTIDIENINQISLFYETPLFVSVCKGIEIDTNISIPKNTSLEFQSGIYINKSFEYISYGNFKTIDDPEYKIDTQSSVTLAYDKIVESMIEYDLDLEYPISIRNMFIKIFERLNWSILGIPSTFTNSSKTINEELYKDLDYTFRDVLDELCESTGMWLINKNEMPSLVRPTLTKEKIDEHFMNEDNISIGKKIFFNRLVLSRSGDSDYVYKEDADSIELYGVKELKIKDNQILSSENRIDFLDELWEYVKTIEYYSYDIQGLILFLDPIDSFELSVNNKSYPTIMLNNEIVFNQDITENIYVNEPNEETTDISYSTNEERKDRETKILVDKINKQIQMIINEYSDNQEKISKILLDIDSIYLEVSDKVDEDKIIASINMTTQTDDNGSEIKMRADKFSLEGYTTINKGFSVDLDGNIAANNANLNDVYVRGGKIELEDDGTTTKAALKIKTKQSTISEEITQNINLSSKKVSLSFPDNLNLDLDGIRIGQEYPVLSSDNGNYLYVMKERIGVAVLIGFDYYIIDSQSGTVLFNRTDYLDDSGNIDYSSSTTKLNEFTFSDDWGTVLYDLEEVLKKYIKLESIIYYEASYNGKGIYANYADELGLNIIEAETGLFSMIHSNNGKVSSFMINMYNEDPNEDYISFMINGEEKFRVDKNGIH